MPRVRIDPIGSISYYRCGRITQAKIYVPAVFKDFRQKRVKLAYKGVEYTVSASPMRRGKYVSGGFKAYLPRIIVKEMLAKLMERDGYMDGQLRIQPPKNMVVELPDQRPDRVLLRIDEEGRIEVLGFGWECKVCGRFTQEPDKLCWNHRIGGAGRCKRCGRMILQPNRTLCDYCLSMLEKVMSK
jgi:hypothetical protein